MSLRLFLEARPAAGLLPDGAEELTTPGWTAAACGVVVADVGCACVVLGGWTTGAGEADDGLIPVREIDYNEKWHHTSNTTTIREGFV